MPKEMKAIKIEAHGGPDVMQLVRIPIPEPGPGEVRIKIEACGLNYSDIMIREGRYVDKMPLPYIMGREFAGAIDKLGPDARGHSVGQRVVGSGSGGALAEYLVIRVAGLAPLPDGLSPAEGAAILIQGITAVHCLEECTRLQSGESVLIHAAAGGVGTLAVQIALAKGAKVFGTASSEEKRKVITDFGATAIDYTHGDWVAELKEKNGGKGVDVILESVGGEVFMRSYREALAIFGRMVVFGVAGGEIVKLSNRDMLESNKSIHGYYLGSYFPRYLDRVAAASMKLLGLIREGKVKPVIGKTFNLDQAAEAFNHMQSRKSIGKVIIAP